MENKKIKVAIPVSGFLGMGGFLDLMLSYIEALKNDDRIELYAYIHDYPRAYKVLRSIYRFFKYTVLGKKRVDSQVMTIEEAKRYFADNLGDDRVIIYRSIKKPYTMLGKSMKANHIDVCFMDNSLEILELDTPTLPYLFDFQHKYLPQFFSGDECRERDLYFEKLLNNAKAVFVEAEAVNNDIEQFYPDHKAQVFVMPYTAFPQEEWLLDKKEIIQKFQLPSNYFLISNQFWMHKDHMTAFRALKRIVETGRNDIYIVCTGKMEDYRRQDYIAEIKNWIEVNKLSNNIIFLGYIKKEEQIEIMKSSIAVIQPTLFEGNPGGGIGYNAVALKKQIILSDIPVNLELKDDCVTYFRAGNDEDLADKMEYTISRSCIMASREELLSIANKRKKQLNDKLYEAFCATADRY